MKGRNKPQPATYKDKNEPTRQFEAIMAEHEDPDFRTKQRILRIREERQRKEDLGL